MARAKAESWEGGARLGSRAGSEMGTSSLFHDNYRVFTTTHCNQLYFRKIARAKTTPYNPLKTKAAPLFSTNSIKCLLHKSCVLFTIYYIASSQCQKSIHYIPYFIVFTYIILLNATATVFFLLFLSFFLSSEFSGIMVKVKIYCVESLQTRGI